MCLTTADKDMGEADKFVQRKDRAKNKCFFGFCPNVKTRYQLSKNAEKKALAIGKLCSEQGLDSVSFQPPLQQIVQPSVYSREALPSRVLMLNQVIDALKDPNLNTVGVYGMGGVGKTTLAKEVLVKVLQDKLFETVVIVAVSHTPEIRRIQGEIADFLGMKFSVDEIPRRASQLHRRLENSKVLIILDDLWRKLDLGTIGIPSGAASKGLCKIMLTSRNRDVLSDQMGARKLFSLELLKEEEVQRLFEMCVVEANDSTFHAFETRISSECNGMPLLIQQVAAKLANMKSYELNGTLSQRSKLWYEEINEMVNKTLESSYENLPGNEIKSFFLLCALFGRSKIRIQHLLTHCMGLGLLKHCHTIEAVWDQVLTFINILKDAGLLMDGDMVGFVKMLDVVRLVALSIACRVRSASVGAGEYKDCNIITPSYCDVGELPVRLNYPEDELLLLFIKHPSFEVPDSFFVGMEKLKVVDFRGMRLVSSLPLSFGLLTNLLTLCLERCQLDNVAILGELKQLEFLSFANSNIVELPKEIEYLVRLKLLDLSSCSYLQVIPAGVLLKLCSLEELYVLNSFVQWDAPGNVSLVELESLARLLTLEIQILDLKLIPVGFKCFNQLRSYKIFIGDIWDWDELYERSRTLKLKGEAGVHLEGGTELLLGDTENLYLDGVRGIQSIFDKGFPKLKHMHVKNDSEIEHLIKSIIPSSYGAFPVLESLYLSNLQRLENICSGQVSLGSFGELQNLKISDCHKLSSIFSFSSFKCLWQLRGLEIESCRNMETVVGEGSEDGQHNNEMLELTQLSSLKLKNLPKLQRLFRIKEGSFPNLASLEVNRCKILKHIFTASMEAVIGEGNEDVNHNNEVIEFTSLSSLKLKNLPCLEGFCKSKEDNEHIGLLFNTMVSFRNLISLEVNGCKSLKHIFMDPKEGVGDEGIEDVYHNNEVIKLTQLSSLKLKNLSNLIGFCKLKEENEQMRLLFSTMVYFPNLTTLVVSGCDSLKHISTASTVKCLMQLKDLKIKDCELDGEIIQSKITEEIEEDATESIVFPKLDCLSLLNLKNVKRFSDRYSFEFPLLTELTVEGCCLAKNVGCNASCSESEVTFSNLERMDVDESSWDGGLLEGIRPHQNIRRISIKYYMEKKLPSWMLRMKSPINGDSFLVLNNLVELKLEWCYNCIQLPCLGNLPHLKNLEMNHMGKVKCIGNDFYGVDNEGSSNKSLRLFQGLETLSLTWMENLTEWSYPSDGEKVIMFPSLKSLSIQYCPKLTGFPSSILSGLEKLEIKDCQELILTIDSQQSLASITGLSITGCSKLKNLQNWLQTIKSFRELTLSKCEWLIFVSYDLQRVSNLTSLEIYCCRRLRYFPEDILSKLTTLQHLSIGAFSEELDDFRYLNRIKELWHLEHLEIWGSDFFGREMHSLPNQLQHLSALKSLKVMGFAAMEALPEWLTNLQSLGSLSLDYCRNLGYESTITTIQRLPNLWHLGVSSCPVLQGRESEWLQPLHSRKIEVELSHVSKVRVRLGYQ